MVLFISLHKGNGSTIYKLIQFYPFPAFFIVKGKRGSITHTDKAPIYSNLILFISLKATGHE